MYLRTLDRYLELLNERGPYHALFEMEPGSDALRALTRSYLSSVASPRGAHGCYFVHVANEHRGADLEVRKAIRRGIAQMRKILTEHVRAAQDEGVMPPQLDPAKAALMVIAVAWGSHVLIEAGASKDDVLDMTQLLFEGGPEPR